MDIVEAYLSYTNENIPTFSTFFQSVGKVKQHLGVKGYLADHYILLYLHLISQIDFIGLQDEVSDAIAVFVGSILDLKLKSYLTVRKPTQGKSFNCYLMQTPYCNRCFMSFCMRKGFLWGRCRYYRTQADRRNKKYYRAGEGRGISENAATSLFVFFCGSAFFAGYVNRTGKEVFDDGQRNRRGDISNIHKK